MSSDEEFSGLVAIVTGGASGIGAATVKQLRSRGAKVATFYHSREPDAGAQDLALQVDVRSSRSVDAGVAHVVDRLGRLDIVVNDAGVSAVGDVTANSDEDWLRVLDVNVVGMARMTRAALPHLRRSPSAAIVNVGSVVAAVGLPQRALYSASKGAVAALTRAMAADHVGEGIRINAVMPGTADTPWVERLVAATDDPVATRAALEARQPMSRLLTADEVASAICYLASPAASAVTGTLLVIDGGLTGLRLPR